MYFAWKAHGISHTIPDFKKLLGRGISDIIREIDGVNNDTKDPNKKAFYLGMKHTLEGVLIYAKNLKNEAQLQLRKLENENSSDSDRINSLKKMVGSLEKVPAYPAHSLRDAITAIWVLWLCLHQENHNAGLSLGRLDQILYPYFENDMESTTIDEERRLITENAIRLIGAFYLKCQDHLPLVPDVGNKLFGGSSSDQALTVGGITPKGENSLAVSKK
ncbi:MAG: pyruvate formate lyase family protein [Promethearchaeota archaeon]